MKVVNEVRPCKECGHKPDVSKHGALVFRLACFCEAAPEIVSQTETNVVELWNELYGEK